MTTLALAAPTRTSLASLWRWTRITAVTALALVGLIALVLAAMIAAPLIPPAPLESISTTARAVDRSDMPPLKRFSARDGTVLAYREYPAATATSDRIAILIHGSSGSSASVHALARALAAKGVTTYAPDIRGHGASGNRGDIGYIGELEDDLEDFVAEIHKAHPNAPLVLIGHSSGGGFALRVAASPIQSLFQRTVLLAPYLGYDATTNRPKSGGWANADIPRIVALHMLRSLGVTCCQALPAVALAVPAHSEKIQTAVYSYRLVSNFGVKGNYRDDLAAAKGPITIISGAADELMLAANYRAAVADFPTVEVKLLDGVNHMGVVSDVAASAAIADDVTTRGRS
jgi:alpha-beta hydrolase superfamily lysophospholipase